MDLPSSRLRSLCAAFPRQRVVVIGDLMLDHVVLGEARRISPEAPIPVVSFLSESFCPGGAANVARNVAALGAAVDLFGVVGDDADGARLHQALADYALPSAGIVVEAGRSTTVKTRITAQRHQIVRLDRETNRPVKQGTAQTLTARVRQSLAGAAAVIVADYAKGVIEQPLLDAILEAARPFAVPVCVDPKPGHSLSFRGCALLTPNRKEIFELAAVRDPGPAADPTKDEALLAAARAIREQNAPAALLVTLSEHGLLLVESAAAPVHIPTQARQVFDVTGAGDTVIASFVVARAAGASLAEAAALANHCAGIVVGKPGTAAVTIAELSTWVARPESGSV